MFIELIGLVAIFFNLGSLISYDWKKILLLSLISTLLLGIVNFSHEAYTGFIVCIASVTFKIIILYLGHKKEDLLNTLRIVIPIIILGLYFLILKDIDQTNNSIYPILGLIFVLIGQSFKDNIVLLKSFILIASVLFLNYSLNTGSISLILYDLIGFIIISTQLIGLIRKRN